MKRHSKVLVCFFLLVGWVDGHGRLRQPPARSSLWRFGYDAPINYDDNQLFCGGKAHLKSQGGRCGICGDPFDEASPRTNEIGGPVYRGFITAEYRPGTIIDVEVEITANHKGFIQFKLCPVPGFNTEASQECLDRHVLKLAGSSRTKYTIEPLHRLVRVRLQLPAGLTCQHCVLQWRYHAGNDWGRCADGSGAVGCGPQEEFYGCADVAVGHRRNSATGHHGLRPTSLEPKGVTRAGSMPHRGAGTGRVPDRRAGAGGVPDRGAGARGVPNRGAGAGRVPDRGAGAGRVPDRGAGAGRVPDRGAGAGGVPNRGAGAGSVPDRGAGAGRVPNRRAGAGGVPDRGAGAGGVPDRGAGAGGVPDRGAVTCVSVGPMARVPGMDAWCQLNCNHRPPHCPASMCRC